MGGQRGGPGAHPTGWHESVCWNHERPSANALPPPRDLSSAGCCTTTVPWSYLHTMDAGHARAHAL